LKPHTGDEPATENVKRKRPGLAAYLEPRTFLMLVLGFSSGLPFLLTGNTFGYWLRDQGTSLAAIGFLSGVGIAYSLKFLWAPIVDRTVPPLLGRLGHRRAWMLASQIVAGLGLIAMAIAGTSHGLVTAGVLALIVAFASATQDIVIDAWRIEIAQSDEELGLLSSAYQLGYRVALIATDALILIAAANLGWPISYALYGLLMGAGIAATLFAPEPARASRIMEENADTAPLWSWRGFTDAVVGPFAAFFRTHGLLAFLMLAAISLYRLPDFMMGPMANPFYHDIGLTKEMVGAVRGSIGLGASFAGIAAGGFCVLRFGFLPSLIVGGILQALAIAAYATLAMFTPSLSLFAAVMTGDNFAISFAGVALVSYMSSLTSLGYTATQYALLTSCYAWIGKISKTFSGLAVEGLSATHGLIGAYKLFFIATGVAGIPAILLFALLFRLKHTKAGSLPAPPR
jgi:PAT family beta-lactamase induction signal transducer AmpG